MVYSGHTVGQQETTNEVRFFLSSLKPKVTTFARVTWRVYPDAVRMVKVTRVPARPPISITT